MNVMLEKMGEKAVEVSASLQKLGINKKNEALKAVADALIANENEIISANAKDIENGKANNMKPALIDRLLLTKERISGMAEGLLQVISLDDPVGEVTGMKKMPNGLVIGTKRVPLGVIGIIYEARPNVTVDAFGLCFKTGNAVILKGGSDAINSNIKIVEVVKNALKSVDVSEDAVQLIEDTNRETTTEFMKMSEYIDVLIPRGSAGLINAVVENSKIPVIETGTGNCHVYVDESADIDMAVDIIFNAKTQRIGVCNALESLVINENIISDALPKIVAKLLEKNVEIRGDEKAMNVSSEIIKASDEDWGKEYLDYIISVKTVKDIDEAIYHINKYNTKHSDSIITSSYDSANKFLDEIDSAAVYVNAFYKIYRWI